MEQSLEESARERVIQFPEEVNVAGFEKLIGYFAKCLPADIDGQTKYAFHFRRIANFGIGKSTRGPEISAILSTSYEPPINTLLKSRLSHKNDSLISGIILDAIPVRNDVSEYEDIIKVYDRVQELVTQYFDEKKHQKITFWNSIKCAVQEYYYWKKLS